MSTSNNTNKVSFINPNTSGIGRSQGYNVDLIVEAALGDVQNEVNNVESVDVIGWSLKSYDLEIPLIPPRLVEEVLVCIKWLDKQDIHRWSISYVSRHTSSTAYADRRWELSVTAPPLVASKLYSKEPSIDDISRFIQSTNFGYNQFDPAFEVVKVISYQKATCIIQALTAGLSEDEKKRGTNST